MAVLAHQPVPTEAGVDLWQCWSLTGLNLPTSRAILEQPPPLAAWVTALCKSFLYLSERCDASISERKRSASSGYCVPMVLNTTDLHIRASREAQQQAAPFIAGRQSDEDEDKRTGLERTCPSEMASAYDYIAVVVVSDGELYAHCPDVPAALGGSGTSMEEVKRNLKEGLLLYFEDVVCGYFPFPPARFRTLEDYAAIGEEPLFAEEGVSFLCLLPCRITLEEIRAWMAREQEPYDPPDWLNSS